MHLGVLGLDSDSFVGDDVITAGLSNVNVATAGYLEPVKGAKVHFEPLLRSSAECAALPIERFKHADDPASLLDGFKPSGQRYTLAVRVHRHGAQRLSRPGRRPACSWPPGSWTSRSRRKPLNLVVFADTDMLSDYLWVRPDQLLRPAHDAGAGEQRRSGAERPR